MRRLVWPAAGVLIVLVGVVLTLTIPAADDYGWFAYTPDAPDSFETDGDLVLMSHAEVAGAMIVALGVVVLAGWLGYRLGRRRT